MRYGKFISIGSLFAATHALAAAQTEASASGNGVRQLQFWKERIGNYIDTHASGLFGAIIILVLGFYVSRAISKFLSRWLESKPIEPPARMLMVRILFLLFMAFTLVIALGTAGMNVTPLVTGIGVAGVGISLAMQGVLSNLVAGLLIIFTKPFRVGEYIEIIGVHGQVETIELFSVRLAHPDRSRIVIPNRRIVGEVLHNYGTIRQLDLSVGVAYHSNLSEAISIVRDILKENPRVLKELAPGVGVSLLADSSINIGVRPWVSVQDYGPAQAEIYQSIVERFRERHVEIPFPQREVRVLNDSVTSMVARG